MRKLHAAHILCTLFTVLLLTACQPIRPDQDMDAQAAQTESAEPATPTPTPPATLLTLQPPTAGEARSAAELFAAISPAVAFVDTPLGTGSAVLIQDNYLLTNAHVVWPYAEVRVVFPDGSEHPDAPVAGWDLIADLALVGPVETQIEPLPLVDTGDLPVGSDVYLVGYPAEEEAFPQPTITTGILSRLRSWERLGYTFFQVDAATIAGQSGGVMVTDTGDFVGLSTFIFSGFGLAGSIADALPRLNTILGHDLGVTIEPRGFPQGKGQREFERTLRDDSELHRYLLREAAGAEIEISVEGVGLPQIYALPLGAESWEQSQVRGPEEKQASLSITVESSDPYIVEVQQLSENRNSYQLISSHPLLAYPDPDDGRVLAAGETYLGAVDLPADQDAFELELKAGERVRFDVDSIGIDPWIAILYESSSFEELVTDNDSGGGLFGTNSSIVYEAPRDGTYKVFIEDYWGEAVGSYLVSVSVPTEDAQLTEPDVSRKLISTSFGNMAWYESDRFDFAILEPVEWEAGSAEECDPAVSCYFTDRAAIYIMEDSLHEYPQRNRTRAGFVDLLREALLSDPGAEELSEETITTVQGLQADRVEFSTEGGQMHTTLFVYVDEEKKTFFALLFFIPTELQANADQLIKLLINFFRVWDTEERENSAAYHLDQAWQLSTEMEFEGALAAYTRSIELNPDLMEAYAGRASLFFSLGRYEEALNDVDSFLESDPDDASIISFRASILWSMGRLEYALAEIDRAIETDDAIHDGYFNLRALILSQSDDFERALADIDMAIEHLNGALPPYLRDSRGYIYLRMGELDKALADFEEVLDSDYPIPHALLGAAVIHGRMGNNERALELISEAMAELEEDELLIEFPDPQLADLLEMAAEFSDEKVDSP